MKSVNLKSIDFKLTDFIVSSYFCIKTDEYGNFFFMVAQSSIEVQNKYKLGTSANIKNLRKATLEKDLIDILPGNVIENQDPTFEYCLKYMYKQNLSSQ